MFLIQYVCRHLFLIYTLFISEMTVSLEMKPSIYIYTVKMKIQGRAEILHFHGIFSVSKCRDVYGPPIQLQPSDLGRLVLFFQISFS